MELPIARCFARSFSRLAEMTPLTTIGVKQPKTIARNLLPSARASLSVTRDFSVRCRRGNQIKDDVESSARASSDTLKKTGESRTPAEATPVTPVVKPFETTYEESSIELHADRLPVHRLTNKPFIKQLFAGIFDTDMLTYPEVGTNQELENLENFIKPYEDLFSSAQALDFSSKKQVPMEFVTAMADAGLFAQAIPKEYGGLGLNSTYLTRMADVTGTIPMAQNLIEVHHNIATHLILGYGSPEQKQKYLPKLATGEMIASLSLHESKAHLDFQNLKTQASIVVDSDPTYDGYTLTGYKTWVPNAHIADLLLVVAQAPVDVLGRVQDEGVSMFIVETTRPGVTIVDRIEGIESPRGLPLYDVTFSAVSLNKNDLLGKGGEADLMTIHTMTSAAHHSGAATAALLKKFTNMLQHFLSTEKSGDVPLYENQSYQGVLTNLQCTAYVMESMAYMTGQLADEYEEPDLTVEQAATRVWCVENLHSTLASVMEVLGIGALENNHPLMNAFLDTLGLKNFPIPLDLMKQYIALSGIRHTLAEKGQVHRTLRDTLNNPKDFFGRVFMMEDIPPMKTLHRHVHDIFHLVACQLEAVCHKFDKAVEGYIIDGPCSGSFLQDQLELERIARIASDIYAMTCVLSQASRSICIGIRYHDQESVMAQFFIAHTCVKVNCEIDLIKQRGVSGSLYHAQLAKDILEAKEYMPRHPLTRTW